MEASVQPSTCLNRSYPRPCDASDPIASEIAAEEAPFALVCSWRGCERGDASAPVVVDRTAVRIEYLIKAVTGPVEQVVMAGVVGIEPDNLPRLNGGGIRRGWARVIGVEEQRIDGARREREETN
jgi:hypothetical protein